MHAGEIDVTILIILLPHAHACIGCPCEPKPLVLDPSNTTLTFHCEIPQGTVTTIYWCLMGYRMNLPSTDEDYKCKNLSVMDCEVEFNLEDEVFSMIPFVHCSADNFCNNISTVPIRVTYNSQEPSCPSCGYLIHVQGNLFPIIKF